MSHIRPLAHRSLPIPFRSGTPGTPGHRDTGTPGHRRPSQHTVCPVRRRDTDRVGSTHRKRVNMRPRAFKRHLDAIRAYRTFGPYPYSHCGPVRNVRHRRPTRHLDGTGDMSPENRFATLRVAWRLGVRRLPDVASVAYSITRVWRGAGILHRRPLLFSSL